MYMGMGKPKTGLFGKPWEAPKTPGIGDGMNEQPMMSAIRAPMEPEAKGGLGTRLFGKGWEDKAFALGGMLRGDPTGAYMMRQEKQREQDALAQAAAEQRKRAQELSDWRMKEDYKRDNPSQTTFQQDYEYIRRNFGEDAANTYRENKINPPVWRQAADGQFYRVETAQPQVLGDSLPEGWEIEGGPTQPASGGF